MTSIVADKENSKETENLNSIRRVDVSSSQDKFDSLTFEPSTAYKVSNHLQELFSRSVVGRTEKERQVIAGLFVKYGDTFSKDDWDLGVTHLAEHPINTGDAIPIKQRLRRVPLAYADEEKTAIKDLLKKGVIQKSK